MNYKQFRKQLKNIGLDTEDIKEALKLVSEDNADFEAGNYRIIHEDSIDDIMKEELSSDTYLLGCFQSWFIAGILEISPECVEKAQANECYKVLGEMLLKQMDRVVDGYISNDGYGHHFASYDGHEYESEGYYIFRIN